MNFIPNIRVINRSFSRHEFSKPFEFDVNIFIFQYMIDLHVMHFGRNAKPLRSAADVIYNTYRYLKLLYKRVYEPLLSVYFRFEPG